MLIETMKRACSNLVQSMNEVVYFIQNAQKTKVLVGRLYVTAIV